MDAVEWLSNNLFVYIIIYSFLFNYEKNILPSIDREKSSFEKNGSKTRGQVVSTFESRDRNNMLFFTFKILIA